MVAGGESHRISQTNFQSPGGATEREERRIPLSGAKQIRIIGLIWFGQEVTKNTKAVSSTS